MTGNVKKEMYGSRNHKLDVVFNSIGLEYEKDIFFITARKRNNPDPRTRYYMFKELHSLDELESYDISLLHRSVRDEKVNRCRCIFIDENTKEVYVRNPCRIARITLDGFITQLLSIMRCVRESGSAKGSINSTPLSRLLRERGGSSISVTDIDYFIPKLNMFVEEKTFVCKEEEDRVYGTLGLGQFISYEELTRDFIRKGYNVRLLFYSGGYGKDMWTGAVMPANPVRQDIGNLGKIVKITNIKRMNSINIEEWLRYDNQSSTCCHMS